MRTAPLFGFLLGVMLVIIGIVSFILLSSKVTLTCIRPSNMPHQCEIVAVGKLRMHKQQIRLDEITGVSIENKTDRLRKRGRQTNYRVVLLTKSGPVPLTEGFSSGMDDKQRTFDQIAAFLRNRAKPTLKIKESDTGIALIVAAVFGAFGLTLIRNSLR
jgi:hypothetical protein